MDSASAFTVSIFHLFVCSWAELVKCGSEFKIKKRFLFPNFFVIYMCIIWREYEMTSSVMMRDDSWKLLKSEIKNTIFLLSKWLSKCIFVGLTYWVGLLASLIYWPHYGGAVLLVHRELYGCFAECYDLYCNDFVVGIMVPCNSIYEIFLFIKHFWVNVWTRMQSLLLKKWMHISNYVLDHHCYMLEVMKDQTLKMDSSMYWEFLIFVPFSCFIFFQKYRLYQTSSLHFALPEFYETAFPGWI